MKTSSLALFSALMIFTSFASAVKSIWIIAPGAVANDEQKRLAIEEKINNSIAANNPNKLQVKIIPEIEDGFAVSYYLYFKKNEPKQWPDYLVYYQPARFFSWDLEEFLFSDLSSIDGRIDIVNLDKDLKLKNTPAPFILDKILSEESALPFKKLNYLRQRIQEVGLWYDDLEPTEQILSMSTLPIETLKSFFQSKSSNKTKFVLFLSPERIRYKRDIFGDTSWAHYLAQAFWVDIGISRGKQKELLSSMPVMINMLPKRFADLHQQAYLKKDSRYILNSTGSDRWADFISAAIAEKDSPIK